jgi:hypothetical protein
LANKKRRHIKWTGEFGGKKTKEKEDKWDFIGKVLTNKQEKNEIQKKNT